MSHTSSIPDTRPSARAALPSAAPTAASLIEPPAQGVPRSHLTWRADEPRRTAATETPGPLLAARDLAKAYHKGKTRIDVLRGVNIEVARGEFLSIVGQSGSGKSTLLHLLGTLDQPDAGEVCFGGERVDNLAPRRRDAFRNRQLGMVFQFYHLLPELTALENVLLPVMIGQSAWAYARQRSQHRAEALRLLEVVGLSHRLRHKPSEMSGGEMQRAAIARALIARPQVLLADEPTGNLDHATGQEILRLLRELNQRERLTIVMVSHDLSIASQADRSVRLVQGELVDAS